MRVKEVIWDQKTFQNQWTGQNITHFLPKSATFETLLNDQVHKTFVCLPPDSCDNQARDHSFSLYAKFSYIPLRVRG